MRNVRQAPIPVGSYFSEGGGAWGGLGAEPYNFTII